MGLGEDGTVVVAEVTVAGGEAAGIIGVVTMKAMVGLSVLS